MTVVAVVGAQWGDEGKGKVVDALSSSVELVVHYAGGSQLGQSVAVAGERFVFDLIPSVPLRAGRACLLAQGMAIDPELFFEERGIMEQNDILEGELMVCERAHVVMPQHRLLDALRDEVEGASGAPRRGIGPCYGDKLARRGVRMGDLLAPKVLEERVRLSLDAIAPVLRSLGGDLPEAAPIVDAYAAFGERLRPFLVDGSRYICDRIKWGGDVLLEAPLGTMVDLELGSYPYVVAAHTVAAGACVGAGIPPTALDKVLGVAKVYTTRAGLGPFPTELSGDLANQLRERGGELLARTGKPRRIGMFDVPGLRHAARVNGFTDVALTKLDVLTGMAEVPLCTGYELDGETLLELPSSGQSRATPVVEMCRGWTQPVGDARAFDDLPAGARAFIDRIEELAEVRVSMIGVGSDRSATIVRANPFG